MNYMHKLAQRINVLIGASTTEDYLGNLMSSGDIKVALDIGCGITSRLTPFRPQVRTAGLDAATISDASEIGAHDHYISADISNISIEEISAELQSVFGRPKADLVTLFGVIEHLPKSVGLDVLDKIEQLSDRYILIDTPNGFVAQGPEYGNPYQRHLSGWYSHEFQARGYNVFGGLGTRYLRGYMGEPRIKIPGLRLFDNVVMTRLLMTRWFPQHAFNICAIKDIRGVPARYESYDDPARA